MITAYPDLHTIRLIANSRDAFTPLHFITSMTRGENKEALFNSIQELRYAGIIFWHYIDMTNMNIYYRPTIGACWNKMCRHIKPDQYTIILDDDNAIHPSMIDLIKTIESISPDMDHISKFGFNHIFTMNQVLKDGSVNNFTKERRPILGGIDAAQMVFEAGWVQAVPFEDTNTCPDGKWAEAVASRGCKFTPIDITCYYNALR